MSKSFKNLLWVLSFVFVLAICLVGCKKDETTEKINLTFDNSTQVYELAKDGSVTAPTVELAAGQELLGWALEDDAVKAKFTGTTIKYDQVKSYAKDGALALYSVVESKIEVTMKGITDSTTKVSDLTLNTATTPLVEQNERQKFLGWALTSDAKEALIASDASVNYNTVKEYATDAKVTLYPVVETYDLMICIHASHSNGNVYMSAEQQAELVKLLEEHFKDKNINILVDRIDGVSATNFAKAAIEKDYDLIIGSKSVVTTGEVSGDIVTAALSAGKAYDVDAESYVTLELVDLNQSRRVGKVTGGSEDKQYQEEAYKLLTTPVDKTIEVTFVNGEQTETITIHRAVEQEGTMVINSETYLPTNTAITAEPEGKVFNGWALEANATEQVFASISYATVYASAVDGKITVYPVYKNAPDFCVLVWGVNGSTIYVTEEEFNNIKNGFTTYLTNKGIDVTGKEIEITYYQGKTDEFKSELTKSYVNAAVGASALSNEDYGTYWTINKDYYANVTTVELLNTKRYIALRSGSESNEIAVAFYRYLTEMFATVSFDGVEGTQSLSSYEKNAATQPTPAEREGLTFIGWAKTADATEAEIAKDVNVNYATVEALLTDGAVKLYPVYVDSESLITYDLIVYVLKGNSEKTYITPEEAEAAIAEFKKLEGNSELVIKLDYSQQGAGADFLTYVDGKGNVDVVIGASNLSPDMYTAEGFSGVTSGKVINAVFTTSSNRWLYIYKTCASTHINKAVEFMNFMCDKQIEVTLHNGESTTTETLSALQANELTLPEVTAAEGYTFLGWSKDSAATSADIAATVASIKYSDVQGLAADGKLDLYAISVDSESLITYDLVVYILRGNSSNEFITEAEAQAALTGFQAWLVQKEITTEYQIKFDYTQRGAGSDFLAYVDGKANGDVVIGASNLNPTMYAETTGAVILNSVFSNTSRWLYIYEDCTAEHLTLANLFKEYMCEKQVEVTLHNGESTTTETLSALQANELALPEVTAAEGYTFLGWAKTSDATEADILATVTSIKCTDVLSLATDGKLDLYAITVDSESLITYDLVVYILRGTASDEYVTEAEAAAALTGFQTWLVNKGYTTQYQIKFDYTQRTSGANFKTYVDGKENGDVVIGASSLNPTMYEGTTGAVIVNSVFSNASRWLYIYKDCKAEHLTLANLFKQYMCDKQVTVTTHNGEATTTETLSILQDNEMTLPTVTAAEGYTFLGWAMTSDATEADIAATVTSIKYNDIKTIVTGETMDLYAIIVDNSTLVTYDLYVYVLRGTTSTVYVTEEEAQAALAGFKAWLVLKGDNTNYNIYYDYSKLCQGADFITYIEGKGNADLLFGPSSLTWEGNETPTKTKTNNPIFSKGRYAYLYDDCAASHTTLANLFIQYMCNPSIKVSVNGAEGVWLSYSGNETLDLTYTPAEGYELLGWATTQGSTTVAISTDVTTLTYANVKDLATNDTLNLYPIVDLAPTEHTCRHVCPVCGKCLDQSCTDENCADKCLGCTLKIAYHISGGKTDYLSQTAKTTMTTALTAKMQQEGLDTSKITITWVDYTGTTANVSAAMATEDYDIAMVHKNIFDSTKVDNPFVTATSYPATVISSALYSGTNTMKVGVSQNSSWNRLAQWLYNIAINYTEEATN